MIDFNKLSDNLELRADGIWYSKTNKEISYPDEGNDYCMQLEDNSYWFKHRNNCIIELVKRFSPNAVFFDVGGGNGFVSLGLEKAGVQTVLLEPGITGATNGKKRGLSNVVCATTETSGIKPETLDAVGVFDVVEHIEDHLGFLKQLYGMLKKGGHLYMSVPAFNFLWCNEDDYSGHYRRYTTATAADVLQKAGFEVKFSSYLFSVLPLPIFLLRSIPSRLGFHKKVDDVEKYKKEHDNKKSEGMLQKVWDRELKKIKAGKPVSFGSSVLMVVQKP